MLAAALSCPPSTIRLLDGPQLATSRSAARELTQLLAADTELPPNRKRANRLSRSPQVKGAARRSSGATSGDAAGC